MGKRDLIVVGGGPAGYVAAIRASQLGARVTVIEEKTLGGTCVNVGCIPTKFFRHIAEVLDAIKTGAEWGLNISGVSTDFTRIQSRKNQVISSLVAGIESLFKGNGIQVVRGRAKLTAEKRIEVELGQGQGKKETLEVGEIIIASGSKSVGLPVPGAISPDVVNAESLLDLDRFPKSVVIIGGGVIGVEIAVVLARFGSKVSIVEMMPRIIPLQDEELAGVLAQALKEDGVTVYTGARVTAVEGTKGERRVSFTQDGNTKSLEAETVAIAVGRRPNTEGLGLDECGVATERGKVLVNERMETNVPGIYAAGDVTGRIMLAHVGFMEGKVAAENALGGKSVMDYRAVPQCIFTTPEIACCGLTEKEATEYGYHVKVGRFPFRANGMAAVLGEGRGFVKIVTDEKYGEILGVHIIGPRATTLIPEATLAVRMKLTPAELAATIHPHPTLSETIWEAALDVSGETIHSRARRRAAEKGQTR